MQLQVANNRNQSSMKTSSRLNLPRWLIAAGLAAMLMLSAQTSMADSATWLASPHDNLGETHATGRQAAHPTAIPIQPPLRTYDTATFNISAITGDRVSCSITLDSFVFTGGAFTITRWA